jgi:hypothetical protein
MAFSVYQVQLCTVMTLCWITYLHFAHARCNDYPAMNATRNLNPLTRWSELSASPPPALSLGKDSRETLRRRVGGSQSWSEREGLIKLPSPVHESNPGRSAGRLVTSQYLLTELSRLLALSVWAVFIWLLTYYNLKSCSTSTSVPCDIQVAIFSLHSSDNASK